MALDTLSAQHIHWPQMPVSIHRIPCTLPVSGFESRFNFPSRSPQRSGNLVNSTMHLGEYISAMRKPDFVGKGYARFTVIRDHFEKCLGQVYDQMCEALTLDLSEAYGPR